MADLGWSSYIAAWEDSEWGPCFDAAAKNNLTPRQAEDCDDFDLACPDCPWKEEFLGNSKPDPSGSETNEGTRSP